MEYFSKLYHAYIVEKDHRKFRYVPDHFKTQEMCNKTVDKDLWMFKYVPDGFKTQEMCNKVVKHEVWMLDYVPDRLKTQGMCDDAVEELPRLMEYVPDHLKTQEMCKTALQHNPSLWEYIPEKFADDPVINKALTCDVCGIREWDEIFKCEDCSKVVCCEHAYGCVKCNEDDHYCYDCTYAYEGRICSYHY